MRPFVYGRRQALLQVDQQEHATIGTHQHSQTPFGTRPLHDSGDLKPAGDASQGEHGAGRRSLRNGGGAIARRFRLPFPLYSRTQRRLAQAASRYPVNRHRPNLAHPPARRAALITLSLLTLGVVACGKGADENAATQAALQDAQKNTLPTSESPLAKAASRGDLEEIRTLLDAGAEINVTDALGRTPLHMAGFYGRPRTTELLLARGADIGARDRVGMTPLHAAVLDGTYQVVDLLLGKGADINAASDSGMTPLHLAASTGQPKVIRLLLQHGANPNSKDKDGKTPQDYAARNAHPKTLALLQQQQNAAKP
ncbi:MAG: hypothetical protein C0489_05145 [Candidatus Accumulibacter sp.]|nr:hypothetical protein [Accumulibacter sp.]MBA4093454.1 hypothetical protein [Accumulibacter sp.]